MRRGVDFKKVEGCSPSRPWLHLGLVVFVLVLFAEFFLWFTWLWERLLWGPVTVLSFSCTLILFNLLRGYVPSYIP